MAGTYFDIRQNLNKWEDRIFLEMRTLLLLFVYSYLSKVLTHTPHNMITYPLEEHQGTELQRIKPPNEITAFDK